MIERSMQGQARSQGIARTDLQQRDLSVEGRELVQARVDIDSGVTAPQHSHPARSVCVIEGTFDVIRTTAAATEAEA
jgi:quercetin dioxygenase-like cupin family protein